MGALIGALYAARKLDGYTEWVRSLTQFDVLRLMDVALRAPGVMRAEKVFAHVRELLDGALIEHLPVPFTAVATDLLARKAVWFQRGPVESTVRASVAIPGVFTPVMLNGRVLVDGGLMDPLPVAPTASARADMTIAVDLGGERDEFEQGSPVRESAEERPVEEWVGRFRSGAATLLDSDVASSLLRPFGRAGDASFAEDEMSPTEEAPEALPAGLGMFDVMNQSLEAMQSVLTRYRLAGNPPDVLITIPKNTCRTLDFHRASDMIGVGRDLTIDALDRGSLLLSLSPEVDNASPGLDR